MHLQIVLPLSRTLVPLLVVSVACSNDATKNEEKTGKVVEDSTILHGQAFFEQNPAAQKAAQEAIHAQARPLFEACGALWAGDKQGGDALYGNIGLRIVADKTRARIEVVGSPTADVSKGGTTLTIDRAVSDCIREAFNSVSYPSNESYSYEVPYPFCVKRPQDCPKSVTLPPLGTQEYFLSLPNWEEPLAPRFEALTATPALQVGEVYKQCRCGICRVVAKNSSMDETALWMRVFQENMRKQWEDSGHYNAAITVERPEEVPEGFFTHAYVELGSQ